MDILSNLKTLINLYGLIFALVLTVPYAVFLRNNGGLENLVSNKGMLLIERIGKFCSIFLMVVNLGILEAGFTAPIMEKFYLVSCSAVSFIYLLLWLAFFKKKNNRRLAYALGIIAGFIVIYTGLLQVRPLLLLSGITFLIGEAYVIGKVIK